MDKNTKQNASDLRRDKVLKVNISDFVDYIDAIERKNGDIKCMACGETVWEISKSELDEKKPELLSIPLPLMPNRGLWVFPLMCSSCGLIINFESTKVVEALEKKGKL